MLAEILKKAFEIGVNAAINVLKEPSADRFLSAAEKVIKTAEKIK